MFYVIAIGFILAIIALIIALPFLVKELIDASKYSPKVEFFGEFPFTDEEWEYVAQKEFIEDERGRRFLDKYSSVISFGDNLRENARRKIFFSSQDIYFTDGEKGKSYTLNKLNYYQMGSHLKSIRLLHLSPLNKLQIVVIVDSSDGESQIIFDPEFLVPIPQSSVEKMPEILKANGKSF